jgi:hypothetical protein
LLPSIVSQVLKLFLFSHHFFFRFICPLVFDLVFLYSFVTCFFTLLYSFFFLFVKLIHKKKTRINAVEANSRLENINSLDRNR